MLTCALVTSASLGCDSTLAQADEPERLSRAFDTPRGSDAPRAKVKGEMSFGYLDEDGSPVEVGRKIVPDEEPETLPLDNLVPDEAGGVGGDSAAKPTAIPPVIQQEPEVSADLSCSRSCGTVEVGGSVGSLFVKRSCGDPTHGGGCNIEDGVASDVHLVDSFPADYDEWICRVYADTTELFDIQVCCLICPLS